MYTIYNQIQIILYFTFPCRRYWTNKYHLKCSPLELKINVKILHIKAPSEKTIIDLRTNILIITTQRYPHHSLLNIRSTKVSLKIIFCAHLPVFSLRHLFSHNSKPYRKIIWRKKLKYSAFEVLGNISNS